MKTSNNLLERFTSLRLKVYVLVFIRSRKVLIHSTDKYYQNGVTFESLGRGIGRKVI